jgi:hypothetical protein
VVAALEGRRHLLPALHRGGAPLRDRRLAAGDPAQRPVLSARRLAGWGLALAALTLGPRPATAQGARADSAQPADRAAPGSSVPDRPEPAFRFSREAGLGLRALWEESIAAKEERVACLGASIRNDTVIVERILALVPHEADSMSIGSSVSIERCGPPDWSGTVHTHVALYTDESPSTRFSAQDRGVMRQWYERWKSDGVFCLIYSARDAHCEADGVVGGMRSRPLIVR